MKHDLDEFEREHYVNARANDDLPTVGQAIQTIGYPAKVLKVEDNQDRIPFSHVLTIETPSGSSARIYWDRSMNYPLPLFAVTRIV